MARTLAIISESFVPSNRKPRFFHFVAEFQSVDYIAVVRQGEFHVRSARDYWLGVDDAVGAGGGVTGVGYGDWAGEIEQVVFFEDLRYQSHLGTDPDSFAVRGGDAGALLPAVLKRIDAKEGDAGRVPALVIDADHATCFAWYVRGSCASPPQIRICVIHRKVRLQRVFAVRVIGTDATTLPRFKGQELRYRPRIRIPG